jgi:tripartite-type tricarboxylate transporter receptor subunit TctC
LKLKLLPIEPKKRRRFAIIAATIAVVLAITAIVLWFWLDFGEIPEDDDVPEQITVTVAWNPGSIADDMVRVMDFGDTVLVLQNVVGTHGARGLNAVYAAEHDGTNLLSTSLTAFREVHEMGFAETSLDDWTWWLVAYSPEYDDYYGLFVPSSVPQERLHGLERLIGAAVATDEFAAFLGEKGLILANIFS